MLPGIKTTKLFLLVAAVMLCSACEKNLKRVMREREQQKSFRIWNWAENKSAYENIPCMKQPLTLDQIKMVAGKVIEQYPQFDSVYVTLLPKRPNRQHDQIYFVTETPTPTFILMRFWGKSDGRPAYYFDPQGDSLHYLSPFDYTASDVDSLRGSTQSGITVMHD